MGTQRSLNQSFKNLNCRNERCYRETITLLELIFSDRRSDLENVIQLSKNIKEGLDTISPFIEKVTQMICPRCRNICCISKHGYYNTEDIIYIFALGLKPPLREFHRLDEDPCQYLSGNGCSMPRSIRPSGCNWYFCDSLLDHMELQPDYNEFDEVLQDIANLWMDMIEEFNRIAIDKPF
jgi:hypothetical protein